MMSDKEDLNSKKEIIKRLLSDHNRKYVKLVDELDNTIYPFAGMNATFIGKYKYALSKDIGGDNLLINTYLNNNNIDLYYEFLSSNERREYALMLDDILEDRLLSLKLNLGISPEKEGFFNKKETFDKTPQNGVVKLHPLTYEYSVFGIQDTLKPLDEFIDEIKAHPQYISLTKDLKTAEKSFFKAYTKTTTYDDGEEYYVCVDIGADTDYTTVETESMAETVAEIFNDSEVTDIDSIYKEVQSAIEKYQIENFTPPSEDENIVANEAAGLNEDGSEIVEQSAGMRIN